MIPRKLIVGILVIASLVGIWFGTHRLLPTRPGTVGIEELTDPADQWPRECREDLGRLSPDDQTKYRTQCADRCAKVFVTASKRAHEYWERAARTRNIWELFAAPVVAGIAAAAVNMGLRRSRRLWSGWTLASLSFAGAALASALLLGGLEASIGDLNKLRLTSAGLLALRSGNLWENERSCKAAIEQGQADALAKIGTDLETYQGLGADFPVKSTGLPGSTPARHDALQPKYDDVVAAMSRLRPWDAGAGASGLQPPATEPGIYDVAPVLRAGAQTHFWAFGPTLLGPWIGWGWSLTLQALVQAAIGSGIYLLVLFILHRLETTRKRAKHL